MTSGNINTAVQLFYFQEQGSSVFFEHHLQVRGADFIKNLYLVLLSFN